MRSRRSASDVERRPRMRLAARVARPHPADEIRHFVPTALIKPVVAAILGIDGGAIFQVLAVEDLHLSSAALGTAFGLGLLSLPLQLWASRVPLTRAAHNLRAFLMIAAAQTVVLAWLLATQAQGPLAVVALAGTIVSEVAISVLFVTAWQPILSVRVSPTGRQRLNARWSAAGKAVLAGGLLVFSTADRAERVAFLIVAAAVTVAAALDLRHLPADPNREPSNQDSADSLSPRLGRKLTWLLVSFAALNLGALPLWLVHLAQSLWPSAPLGAIGAAQTLAVVAAQLAWRPTENSVARRALIGTLPILLGALCLAIAGPQADNGAQQGLIVVATVGISAGTSISSLALLEMTHRLALQRGDVVRVLTVVDVVDSSSLQLGLFAAGLLSPASPAHTWLTPYSAYILVINGLATVAIHRVTNLLRPQRDPTATPA